MGQTMNFIFNQEVLSLFVSKRSRHPEWGTHWMSGSFAYEYTKVSHTGIQQYLYSNIKSEGFLDQTGIDAASNEESELEDANTKKLCSHCFFNGSYTESKWSLRKVRIIFTFSHR